MKGRGLKLKLMWGVLLVCTLFVLKINDRKECIAAESTIFKTTGFHVEYRTQKDIHEYINSHPLKWKNEIVYSKEDTLKVAEDMGKLSEETFNYAFGMINQIRFVAGLEEIVVKRSDELIGNHNFSPIDNLLKYYDGHNDIQDSFMKNGYQLISEGTEYNKYFDISKVKNKSVLHGYMSSLNEEVIGNQTYRRRILYPFMTSLTYWKNLNSVNTVVGSSSMPAMVRPRDGFSVYGVMWPAQTMPIDFFDVEYPWSISMGEIVDIDKIKVNLTRVGDNKQWEFSKEKSDGYFFVNNEPYGQVGCIIFWPEGIEYYKDQEQYRVSITGLSNPVSYQVTFFDLYPVKSIYISTDKTSINIGETIELNEVFNSMDMKVNQGVIWSSSNDDIAKVNQQGVVEGVNPGIVTIKVTHLRSGLSATKDIKIKPPKLHRPELSINDNNELNISYIKDPTVTGYQILYATNIKFKKSKEIVITNADVNHIKISKLRKQTVYYVKVRAYYETNGVIIYGDYSSFRAITTNK